MADNREKITASLIKAQERYQQLLNMQEKSGKDYSASLQKQNEKVKKLGESLKKVNQSNQSFVGELEKGISSIGKSYGEFSNSQKEVMDSTKSMSSMNSYQKEIITSILSDSRDLSDLNAEDVEQINAKLAGLEAQMGIAKAIFGIDSEIVKKLEKQRDKALEIANITKEQKEVLDKQEKAAEALKTMVQGVTETAETFVTNLKSGKGIMGLLLIGAGKFAGSLAKVNKELGQVGEGLSGAAGSAAVMSLFFDDAAINLKALSAELGGTERISFRTQANINLMANNLGITGTEASKLQGSLSRLSGGSLDTAANLTAGAREFARMNNIPVAQLMGDVAGATEEFALFGREGGKNIIEAAGAAAKLGTNMSTLSGIAEGLLDFENSITKELELSAMLGKNINLNRARGLAYEGDIVGATKETLNQLGGIDAFNRMDYFQKKQTAALLGVSVAELQKMADGQERMNKMTQLTNGSWSGLTEGLKAAAAEFGPKILDWSGKFLTLSAQAGQAYSGLGPLVSKITGGGGGGATDVMKNATTSTDIASKTRSKPSGLKGLAGGLRAMGNTKVLFGALNLIPTALGFLAILPGIPGMLAVGLIGPMAGAGLKALGLGLKSFGNTVSKALPQIGIGLLALAAFGLALLPTAYAMNLAAPAFEAFGTIITSVFAGVATVITSVAGGIATILDSITIEKALAMGVLGASFGVMAFGIGALATAAGLGGFVIRRFLRKTGESIMSIGAEGVENVNNLALALNNMAGGLTAVVTQLDRLDTEKLEALSSVSISASIGGAISGIGDSIGGLIDSVSGVVGGESMSEYETTMLDKMEELKGAFLTNKDVFLDKDKVTNLVMAKSEKTIKNNTNINNQ